MDLEIISKLLSLHCNNAEIIAQEETGAYNVTLKEMPDVLAFDKSVNRLFVINLTNLEVEPLICSAIATAVSL